MSRRVRIIAVALAALALFSPAGSVSAAGLEVEGSPAGIRISVSEAPLAALLREVGRTTGVSVRGLEHVAGSVSAEFDLPLGAALRRLLQGYSFVLVEGAGERRLLILGQAGEPGGVEIATGGLRGGLWGAGGVERLASVVGEEALGVLLEASASADLEARLAALGGLAQHGPETAEVLAAAVADPDPAVRFVAVQHLVGAGPPAAPHLLKVFREAKDPELRLMALSAVAGSGGAASEDLLALALRDPDPGVRAHAEELSRGLTFGPPAPGQ